MAIFFLVTIVIFGSFFALNLVLAQIMDSFACESEKQKDKKER